MAEASVKKENLKGVIIVFIVLGRFHVTIFFVIF